MSSPGIPSYFTPYNTIFLPWHNGSALIRAFVCVLWSTEWHWSLFFWISSGVFHSISFLWAFFYFWKCGLTRLSNFRFVNNQLFSWMGQFFHSGHLPNSSNFRSKFLLNLLHVSQKHNFLDSEQLTSVSLILYLPISEPSLEKLLLRL